MVITKNSLVQFSYYSDTDYGVISEIINEGDSDQYWSAWHNYHQDSYTTLESLTLIGPSILGTWNDD